MLFNVLTILLLRILSANIPFRKSPRDPRNMFRKPPKRGPFLRIFPVPLVNRGKGALIFSNVRRDPSKKNSIMSFLIRKFIKVG